MRLVGAAFVTGILGVLIGSLAAQAPRDEFEPRDEGVIYEGTVEVILNVSDDPIEAVLTGNARVYEGWVMLTETRRLIPRERIQMVAFDVGDRAVEEREDFGNTPGGNTPGDVPPRRKPFRED